MSAIDITLANKHFNDLATLEPLNSTTPTTTQRPPNLLYAVAMLVNTHTPRYSNELASAHFLHCYLSLKKMVRIGKMKNEEFETFWNGNDEIIGFKQQVINEYPALEYLTNNDLVDIVLPITQ